MRKVLIYEDICTDSLRKYKRLLQISMKVFFFFLFHIFFFCLCHTIASGNFYVQVNESFLCFFCFVVFVKAKDIFQ